MEGRKKSNHSCRVIFAFYYYTVFTIRQKILEMDENLKCGKKIHTAEKR